MKNLNSASNNQGSPESNIHNFNPAVNKRNEIDIQELSLDVENLFEAIHQVCVANTYNEVDNLDFVIQTLAKAGKEKIILIQETY